MLKEITHQGPPKVICTLHSEPSWYVMGCDCNVCMRGERGNSPLGHSLGLSRSALDQEDPAVTQSVGCPPPSPEDRVQTPQPAAGTICHIGIHIN